MTEIEKKNRDVVITVKITSKARKNLEKKKKDMRIPTAYGDRDAHLGEVLTEILENLEV